MRVVNRKALFNYEILETVEAGMVLSGGEAKSAAAGQVSMDGAFVRFRDNEAWIVNMHIHPYQYADNTEYDPVRSRKLLLSRNELLSLQSKMKQKRATVVPTAVYTRGPRVKLEIGIARGKKKFEKREIIKKRDLDREMGR